MKSESRNVYKFNCGSLIWSDDEGWTIELKPKLNIPQEDHILVLRFLMSIALDISGTLDKMQPSGTNIKLFKKTMKKLFKPYRAKLIKHKYEGKLPGRAINILSESEMKDINTRLYSMNFIWSSRILHSKKGLHMPADELSYMIRSTDKDKCYLFERYGVYYEAHGPKSIKEITEPITLW